ncbi:MAG: acVLRF1 family peptidyl-tRNA hydrolase [Propionicimonas sp.]
MATPALPLRTVRVEPERLTGWLDRFALRHGAPDREIEPELVRYRAPDGAVATVLLQWGPLPPGTTVVEYATATRTVGALLARRRAHAVGVFSGTTLIEGHHHSHYVQGRTKAGGWSQQRYARRREQQAGRSFTGAAAEVADILLPVVDDLDALVLGGDRVAVKTVLADPAFAELRTLAEATHHPIYPVPDPNRGILTRFAAVFRAVPIQLNELA